MASKFDPDKYLAAPDSAGFDPDEYLREKKSQGESAIRGAAQGLSLGFADEITGALESAVSDKTYEQSRDESRKEYSRSREDNPWTHGGAEVAGSVATAFIPGVNTVKGAALLGAASGLGMSEEDDLAGLATDTAIGGAVGGVAQKVIPGAVDKLKSAGSAVGKKLGRVAFDVNEEATEKYLANPEKMRKVIKDGEEKLINIKDTVDEAYDRNVNRVLEEAKDMAREHRQRKIDTRSDLRDGMAELRNIKPPEITDELVNAIRGEDKKLSQLSGKAFETLEGTEFERGPILDKIQAIKGKLLVDGQAPQLGDSAPAFGILTKLEKIIRTEPKPRFDSLINEAEEVPGIAGREVKRLIQQLDQESQAAYTTYGSRGAAKYIKESRDEISDLLKGKVPAYAEAMVPTAQQARLVAQLKKVFGTEEKARRALTLAGDPAKGEGIRTYLEALDNLNGTDFSGQMQDFLAAQHILRNPESRIAFQKSYLDPIAEEGKRVEDLREIARQAKFNTNRVGPRMSEKTIKRIGQGGDQEGLDQLRLLMTLDDGTGEAADDLVGQIKDYNTGKQFRADRTNGSRRTMAGTAIGSVIGSVGGFGVGSAIGGALGAAGGAAIDKLGGRIWQAVLDGTLVVGPYAKVLEKAAKEGPAAVGTMHIFLMQNYPDYKKSVEENGE